MNALIDNVSVLWDRLLALFSSYNIITDTLDIAFVAFLVFSAIKMLKENIDVNTITKITGLSKKQINDLKREL